ncbi:MAG: YciI family protein [Devosia sp.]
MPMPYFSVYALDRPGMDERRGELRAAHRQRLRRHDHPVTVRIGGPLLGDDGGMIGSLFVIEAADRAEVERYMAGDHYVLAGVFGSVEIRKFAWGLGQPEAASG